MTDFLVMGAGISGLLLARELSQAGASVCVIDKGAAGREASWAGGGIVSPLYPWRYSDAVTALANYAQSAYPALAAELLAETAIDPQLSPSGLLMLDADDHEQALAWANQHQRPMQALQPAAIYEREPLIAAGATQALWMPNVANIRNPRLLKALKASVLAQPLARIVEHCEVVAIHAAAGKVSGIEVVLDGKNTRLHAAQYVVTAGAWSGNLLSTLTHTPAAEVQLKISPVKGQMLLYQTRSKLLTSIVLSKGRYLIPRAGNLVLAGSTLEHNGFDKTVDEQAKTSLAQSAVGILPALADAEIVGHWAGLRPGAPAGVPYIGRLPGYTNLCINAGHYRNGLVLAPAAARLTADILLGRTPVIDPAPYDPAATRASDPAFS